MSRGTYELVRQLAREANQRCADCDQPLDNFYSRCPKCYHIFMKRPLAEIEAEFNAAIEKLKLSRSDKTTP